MRRLTRRYVRRHEPGGIRPYQIKAGIGAAIAIIALGLIAHFTGRPLLLAPFGASSVLLFGQPRSPLAQPVNVLGGYLVASLSSFVLLGLFPGSLVAAGIAVGLSITIMLMLRISHPPAGAVPLVVMVSPLGVGLLLESVMAGAAMLVILAIAFHHLPPRQTFPLDIDLG
jgi:CBS-domain-containing membrane protein